MGLVILCWGVDTLNITGCEIPWIEHQRSCTRTGQDKHTGTDMIANAHIFLDETSLILSRQCALRLTRGYDTWLNKR